MAPSISSSALSAASSDAVSFPMPQSSAPRTCLRPSSTPSPSARGACGEPAGVQKRGVMSRGSLMAGGSAGAATLLSGCDPVAVSDVEWLRPILDFGQVMSMHAQRFLLAGQPLVREFTEADISPGFPPNGTERPNGMAYFRHMMSNFADFRLTVDGMVKNPLSLTLDEVKAMPSRTQITMHNCDEGWSAIGQWTGVPLRRLLGTAELF